VGGLHVIVAKQWGRLRKAAGALRALLQLNGAARARLWIKSGGAGVSTGVGVECGTGWGLVVAGVASVAYGLWVVDLDDEPKRGGRG
jgi:hypothetical protein